MLLLVTMALSCIISEIKRDTDRKARFFIPLHLVPPLGSPLDYCHTTWHGKTRMVWLADGEKSPTICLAISMEYWHMMDRQTDRWTDRQTSGDGIARLCIASHAKNL